MQGRPLDAAVVDVFGAGCDGVQLAPGNAPRRDGVAPVDFGVSTCTHHGFAWDALRRLVWSPTGELLVTADSTHPPRVTEPAADHWWDRLARGEFAHAVFEVMYPGWTLGTGAEIRAAMAERVALAVDISHLWIQMCAGVVDDATVAALLAYEHVVEVHVSANDGRRDQHRPIDASTFGLEWARERLASGTRVVVESYWHRLSTGERRAQVDLVRGTA